MKISSLMVMVASAGCSTSFSYFVSDLCYPREIPPEFRCSVRVGGSRKFRGVIRSKTHFSVIEPDFRDPFFAVTTKRYPARQVPLRRTSKVSHVLDMIRFPEI